jgi:hypothetical protein
LTKVVTKFHNNTESILLRCLWLLPTVLHRDRSCDNKNAFNCHFSAQEKAQIDRQAKLGRHDTRYNDIQQNNIQHKEPRHKNK